MRPYKVILADDHAIFRQGIREIINDLEGFQVIGEAGDGLQLLELLKKVRPDLVVLDISMPNLRGLEATEEIKKHYPQIKVLLLTMHKKKSFVHLGLQAGADGFLLKEDADSELFKALGTIKKGQVYLSPLLTNIIQDLAISEPKSEKLSKRERQVLKLLAEGKTPAEIAQALYISVPTVRTHRARILNKLSLKTQTDLVKYAIAHGLTSVE